MNLSNPLDIVIALLTAFDKKDWDAIVPYFDSANQRRFLPWSEEHKQKFVQYIEKKTSPIIPFNIKEIQDVRAAPEFYPEGSVIVKIGETTNKIIVITLLKEGEHYLFEDISIPSITEFNELKKI